jgi:hypothetical protein
MSTSDAYPFSKEQREILDRLFTAVEQYIHGVQLTVSDLGREFIVLKEMLEDKSVITADEFVVHLEKALDDVRAAQIATQHRKFFDELRDKLGEH